MNSREKKIFFAGVSVGTQLKGWASAGGGEDKDPGGLPKVIYAAGNVICMGGDAFILSSVPEIIVEVQTEE